MNQPLIQSILALQCKRILSLWLSFVLFVLLFPLHAETRSFEIDGVPVLLEDVSPDVAVFYRSMRFNRVQNSWNAELVVSNRTDRVIQTPLVLWVTNLVNTSGPMDADGTASQRPFYNISPLINGGELAPGKISAPRTISLRMGTGAPKMAVAVFAPSGPLSTSEVLALVRTLDATGHPLPETDVEEKSPLGIRSLVSESNSGLVTLGGGGGLHQWKFSRQEYVPVWRQRTLGSNQVSLLESPRLTVRSTNVFLISPFDGGSMKTTGISLSFGPGSFPSQSSATITELTAQTIPALLPAGWSPLQAFWFESTVQPGRSGLALLQLWDTVAPQNKLALVRWNEEKPAWEVVHVLSGTNGSVVSVPIGKTGAYAMVIADLVPLPEPPAAVVGQVLPGIPAGNEVFSLTAGGKVEPSTSTASRNPDLVTGTALLVVSNSAGLLSSGKIFRGDVSETYQMTDGSRRDPPRYETFLVGYQRPGDRDPKTLHNNFPIRPLLLLDSEELREALIKVEIQTPTAFSGAVVSSNGGSLTAGTIRVTAGQGAVEKSQAATLRQLSTEIFRHFSTNGNQIVAAFELNAPGIVSPEQILIQTAALETNQLFVLARVLLRHGITGLQPVRRYHSDAQGRLASQEPLSGDRLSGVNLSGQYLLVQVGVEQGIVRGITRNAAGLIRVQGQPWAAFADAAGNYRLLSPTGRVHLAHSDLLTGETSQLDANSPSIQNALVLDFDVRPTGPRVVTVSPATNSVGVSRISPVIVTFSKAVSPGTIIGAGLQLLGTNGQAVPASLSLNLRNTIATLLPTDPLAPSSVFTIRVAPLVTDLAGLALEGTNTFTFTTAAESLTRDSSTLTIHELPNGSAGLSGGSGLAEPEAPVILVNETTGFTSTVLSKVDGSFSNSIPASADDELVVVIVNKNGTQNRIKPSRQIFADGSVGLFAAGGEIQTPGPDGLFSLALEPGSSQGRTILKITPVPLSRATNETPHPQLMTGIAAVMDVTLRGDKATGPASLSVPFDPQKFDVPPGVSPTNMTFSLAVVRVVNGEVNYQVVDQMFFQNGRLEASRTSPFSGWLDGLSEDENPLFAPSAASASSIIANSKSGIKGPQTKFLLVSVFGFSEIARMVVLYAFDPPMLMMGKVGICPVQLEDRCLEEHLDPFFSALGLTAGFVSGGGADIALLAVGAGLDQLVSRGRIPLRGAIVDAALVVKGQTTKFNAAGQPYGISDRGGNYRLLLPRAREVFLARARHPSQSQPRTAPVAPLFENLFISPNVRKNFSFLPDTGINLPPLVTIQQRPLDPGTNVVTSVIVDVVHPLAPLATLSIIAQNIRPLAGDTNLTPPSLSNLILTGPTPAAGASNNLQKRFLYTLQSDRPMSVQLKITAAISFGVEPVINTKEWNVVLGGEPTVQNLPLQSDSLDKVGPSLVRTEPIQDGTLGMGQPIRLIFNEPIDASVTNNSGVFSMLPSVPGGLGLRLSADQTVLELQPPLLESGKTYTLNFQSAIKDLATNPIQSSSLSGMNLSLRFRTPAVVSSSLPGIGDGGGAVTEGNIIYALDRSGSGRLVIYDAGNPRSPLKLAEQPLPGFPRDLEYIPNWSYFLHSPVFAPGELPLTNRNLLMVVGGLTGLRDTALSNFEFSRQYLRVYDVTDPAKPTRVAFGEISARPATVQKVTWHPPQAAFFENGADLQQVVVLDLQAFILAYNLAPGERQTFFFDTFRPGDDGSGFTNGVRNTNPNGHYADAGDKLPVPERDAVDFFGRQFSLRMRFSDGTRSLLDYAYDDRFGYGALVFSGGVQTGLQGEPTPVPLAPGYRTAFFNGELLAPSATVPFAPGARPKRVHLEFQVNVSETAVPDLRNLAFVSLAPDADGVPKLAVIDVTDPVLPKLLPLLTFPAELGLGQPQSIYRLPNGQLALAMTTDALVLDPTLALRKNPVSGLHAMFRSRLPGAGSGNQTLNVSSAGIFTANLGGRHEVVQMEPRMRFVQFGSNDLFQGNSVPLAQQLKQQPSGLSAAFATLREQQFVRPASLSGLSSNTPSLIPPSRDGHYYVLVDAPGGAGGEIKLGLQSLNRAGHPLRNKGYDFAAVRAVSSQAAAAIQQTPRAGCDAPIKPLLAFRLSDDPKSEFFNRYLSEPFALVVERAPLAKLGEVQSNMPRAVLWSGFFLSAFIDSTMGTNQVLGPFAARIGGVSGDGNDLMILPSASVTAETFPGTYIPGSNPPPLNGHETMPGTFGMVSAHNGEIRHDTIDLSVPGRGMPIVFERTFGGQDLFEGAFGKGWDFFYNQQVLPLRPQTFGSRSDLMFAVASLTNTTGTLKPFAKSGDLVMTDGSGHVVSYFFAGTEPPKEVVDDPLVEELRWMERTRRYYLPYEEFPGIFDPIFEFFDGSFARLTPQGEQFWYDRMGRLTKIYDKHPDNFQELIYNERSELIRVIDRAVSEGGRYLELGHYRMNGDLLFISGLDVRTKNVNAIGKIARLRDFTGRNVDFEYDQDGILLRRLGIAGNGLNESSAARPQTEYLWSGGCQGTMGGISTSGEPSQQDSALFAASMNLSNQKVQSQGNGVGGPVTIDFPTSGKASSITGPDQAKTEWKFDSKGYPTEKTESGPLNGKGVTKPQYNLHGLLIRSETPLGDVTQWTYDSSNKTLRARANLLKKERIPGPRGGPTLTQLSPTYDLRYNLPVGVVTDYNGKQHTYALNDNASEVEKVTHGTDGISSWSYNRFGQRLSANTPQGLRTQWEFDDSSGFMLAEIRGQNRTELRYDGSSASQLGRPTKVIPPRGAEVEMTYDDRLLPIQMTRGTQVAKLGYDANGNVVYSEHKASATERKVERRKYNRLNFLEETTVEAVDVNGVALPLVTKYHSTALDAWRVRKITYPGGQVREFDYDHLGREVKMKLGNYSEIYQRDIHGNLEKLFQGDKEVQRFVYDGHDRVIDLIVPVEGGEMTTRQTYYSGGEIESVTSTDKIFGELYKLSVEEIDALGRPKKQKLKGSSSDAITEFEYPTDSTGGKTITRGPRDTRESSHDSAGYSRGIKSFASEITFTPDKNGNLEKISSREGGRNYTATSSFDALDHLLDFRDDLGLLSKYDPRPDGSAGNVTDGRGKTTRKKYTVLGELSKVIRANNVEFNFRRDKNRQLVLSGDAALQGIDATYDTGTFRPVRSNLRADGSFYLFEDPNHQNLPQRILIPGGSMQLKYDPQGSETGQDASYAQGFPYKLTYQRDGLGRVRTANYGSGTAYNATFKYDLLGPVTESTFTESHGRFIISSTINDDGSRATLTYPSGVVVGEDRDPAQRLLSVRADGTEIYRVSANGYVGSGQRGEVLLGNGVREINRFDLRRRIAARTFTRISDNAVLADVRYRYDAANNIVARQELHRHGRTDRFVYDDGNRLIRADIGLRPEIKDEIRHSIVGLEVDFDLKHGQYARQFQYDGQGFDLLETISTLNPNSLTVSPIPFAQKLENPDVQGNLFQTRLDGVDRPTTDPLGNVAGTRLLLADFSGNLRRVSATLKYSASSQLMQLNREDGFSINYEHQPNGFVHRRRFSNSASTNDLALIWDEGRLIEEHEKIFGTNRLRARYFYADEDSPFAADLIDAQGQLRRFWYLRDAMSSVVAIVDEQGQVVERMRYDSWGQAVIEGRDQSSPQAAFVSQSVNGQLLLQFSEAIFPKFSGTAAPVVPGADGALFAGQLTLPTDAVKMITATGLVSAEIIYEEDLPVGFTFSGLLRVRPQATTAPILGMQISGGFLVDEWGNANRAETLTFVAPNANGTIYEGPPALQDTRAQRLGRSAIGSPMLFHGQYFDPDAGLLYLRARFYDPSTGGFLQQDPMDYNDSPNLYSGFANNPTSYRDPTGKNKRIPGVPDIPAGPRGKGVKFSEAKKSSHQQRAPRPSDQHAGRIAPENEAGIDPRLARMAEADDNLGVRNIRQSRKASPKHLESLFGEAQDPTFVRTKNREGEAAPPGLQVVELGGEVRLSPYKDKKGNHGKYLYVVDENGSLLVAPESPPGVRMTKHTDLTRRGKGRVGGEFVFNEADGTWKINIDSGRYSATYTKDFLNEAEAVNIKPADLAEVLDGAGKLRGLQQNRINTQADNVVKEFRFGEHMSFAE